MSLHIPIVIDKKLFFLLFAGFVLATVVGTVSHEYGHYLISRLLGYKGQHISYAFTTIGYNAVYTSTHFDKTKNDPLLFTIGGPLATIMVGTFGFLLLCLRYTQTTYKQKLPLQQWLLIFLALFWLRELFNFVCATTVAITGNYTPNGDEFWIAKHLNWNGWVLSGLLAFFALAVLLLITFRFIPLSQRFTFLTGGFLGGIAGAIFWLVLLGPVLMP
jgi:hypothetical protein